MRRTLGIFIAVGGVLAATIPVAGHHAFGAEFDPDAPIRLQGKVVKLEWVNPHAWIHIEVKKPDGLTEVWMVEGGTPNTLLRRGLMCYSLTYGTELIVDGYQTKDHSLKRANGRDVTFADGRKIFMAPWAPARRPMAATPPRRRRDGAAAKARGRTQWVTKTRSSVPRRQR